MPDVKLVLSYNKIQVLGFNLNIPDELKIEINKKELFFFTYNFNTDINLEKEFFTVNLEIILTYKENQICTLKALYEYLVIGLKEIAKKEGNVIGIPDQIPAMLISNAISTSRGILFMKTAGTQLENIYLPVVNTDTILKSKIEKTKEGKV
jgi:hypothetical protein